MCILNKKKKVYYSVVKKNDVKYIIFLSTGWKPCLLNGSKVNQIEVYQSKRVSIKLNTLLLYRKKLKSYKTCALDNPQCFYQTFDTKVTKVDSAKNLYNKRLAKTDLTTTSYQSLSGHQRFYKAYSYEVEIKMKRIWKVHGIPCKIYNSSLMKWCRNFKGQCWGPILPSALKLMIL